MIYLSIIYIYTLKCNHLKCIKKGIYKRYKETLLAMWGAFEITLIIKPISYKSHISYIKKEEKMRSATTSILGR